MNIKRVVITCSVIEKWDEHHLKSMLHHTLELSLAELNLINSSTQYTSTSINNETKTGESVELYFKEHLYFLAESGIVVTDKQQNYFGKLMSVMLTLNSNVNGCSRRDKELLWLGHLYAGLPFEFEPTGAVLMGFPKNEYDKNDEYLRTTLCNTHIAHAHNSVLMWRNGCMTRAKSGRGGSLELKDNPRMQLNGFLISDGHHGLCRETKHMWLVIIVLMLLKLEE